MLPGWNRNKAVSKTVMRRSGRGAMALKSIDGVTAAMFTAREIASRKIASMSEAGEGNKHWGAINDTSNARRIVSPLIEETRLGNNIDLYA